MGNPRVVWGIRLEADGEDIVLVVPGNVEVLCARLIMMQMKRRQLKLWHVLGALQRETMEPLARLG